MSADEESTPYGRRVISSSIIPADTLRHDEPTDTTIFTDNPSLSLSDATTHTPTLVTGMQSTPSGVIFHLDPIVLQALKERLSSQTVHAPILIMDECTGKRRELP